MARVEFDSDTRGPGLLKHPYPGVYCAFEGGEGGGKTTQQGRLVSKLEAEGYKVLGVREPGGTQVAERIRAIILDHNIESMGALAEVFLFAASRAELIQKRVRPALEKGEVVSSDRTFYSSMAYQAAGRSVGAEVVWAINQYAVGDCVPDLVFFMNIDPELGLARRAAAGGNFDRLDRERLAFHRDLYEGYLLLAKMEPERWVTVDATLSEDEVWEVVWTRLRKELTRKMIRKGDGLFLATT